MKVVLRTSFVLKGLVSLLGTFGMIVIASCGGGDDPEPPTPPPGPTAIRITVNPAITHQEMIGFGGALTWYSNWAVGSTRNEIANLIFDDLGLDIVRFQNWYFPDNYPVDKTTNSMSYDNARQMWEVTNEWYDLAMARNPDIKILLSSWGPPKQLKSNDSYREGTLKKTNDAFMYDEYAQYWVDALDHIPFDPDYISMQNEPTYVNAGWTTCDWNHVETASLPSYMTAFDKVYDQIKDRNHVPVMIGPESQDLLGSFTSFADLLENKPHCGVLAYHPYNINGGTSSSQIDLLMNTVAGYDNKPSLMTEFADNLDWFNTAVFIQKTLNKANSSGYIYWKLLWDADDVTMVGIGSYGASTYTVTPFYYLIKHFSKDIDAGYFRVDASASAPLLNISAFSNPAGDKLTVIVINEGTTQSTIDLAATGKTIKSITGNQSKSGTNYQSVTIANPADAITLPAKSITTFVLTIE